MPTYTWRFDGTDVIVTDPDGTETRYQRDRDGYRGQQPDEVQAHVMAQASSHLDDASAAATALQEDILDAKDDAAAGDMKKALNTAFTSLADNLPIIVTELNDAVEDIQAGLAGDGVEQR